jgi:hypothetical protein
MPGAADMARSTDVPDLFAPPAPTPPPPPARQIAHVYRVAGGRVVTFDQFNRLMHDYTGDWEDLRERIQRDAPPNVQVR